MSFGFSPSDIITLVSIASKAYNSWKNAPGDFNDITDTLRTLTLILERVARHFRIGDVSRHQDDRNHSHSSIARSAQDQGDIGRILNDCKFTVTELQKIVDRFSKMKEDRKLSLSRIKYSFGNRQTLRERVRDHIQRLSAFLMTVELSSIDRLNCAVDSLPDTIAERLPVAIGELIDARMADARGTTLTDYESDSKLVWKEFRRKMVKVGINSDVIRKYQPQLEAFLRDLTTDDQDQARSRSEASIHREPRVEMRGQATEVRESRGRSRTRRPISPVGSVHQRRHFPRAQRSEARPEPGSGKNSVASEPESTRSNVRKHEKASKYQPYVESVIEADSGSEAHSQANDDREWIGPTNAAVESCPSPTNDVSSVAASEKSRAWSIEVSSGIEEGQDEKGEIFSLNSAVLRSAALHPQDKVSLWKRSMSSMKC